MRHSTRKKQPVLPAPNELDRITADLDREFVADAFRPLTDEESKTWHKAKRKRGRPVQGQGSRVISVSIEKRLLEKTDRHARKKRVSRAQLIARGLRAVLAAEAEGRKRAS